MDFPCTAVHHAIRAFAIKRSRRKKNDKMPSAPAKDFSRPVDDQIKAKEVRVVLTKDTGDGRGETDWHEVMKTEVAIQKAKEQKLQLVQMNKGGDLPVCRIMDYNAHILRLKEKHTAQVEARRELIVAKGKTKGLRIGCASPAPLTCSRPGQHRKCWSTIAWPLPGCGTCSFSGRISDGQMRTT